MVDTCTVLELLAYNFVLTDLVERVTVVTAVPSSFGSIRPAKAVLLVDSESSVLRIVIGGVVMLYASVFVDTLTCMQSIMSMKRRHITFSFLK